MNNNEESVTREDVLYSLRKYQDRQPYAGIIPVEDVEELLIETYRAAYGDAIKYLYKKLKLHSALQPNIISENIPPPETKGDKNG